MMIILVLRRAHYNIYLLYNYSNTGILDSIHTNYLMYSQTCIKRSLLEQRKSGIIRQVTF